MQSGFSKLTIEDDGKTANKTTVKATRSRRKFCTPFCPFHSSFVSISYFKLFFLFFSVKWQCSFSFWSSVVELFILKMYFSEFWIIFILWITSFLSFAYHYFSLFMKFCAPNNGIHFSDHFHGKKHPLKQGNRTQYNNKSVWVIFWGFWFNSKIWKWLRQRFWQEFKVRNSGFFHRERSR